MRGRGLRVAHSRKQMEGVKDNEDVNLILGKILSGDY